MPVTALLALIVDQRGGPMVALGDRPGPYLTGVAPFAPNSF
jgi:hypothetical protein